MRVRTAIWAARRSTRSRRRSRSSATTASTHEDRFPADTLFQPRWLDDCDAVVAMYHDQGLPVLKFATFGQGVNVTLGLPIVRTSVDHGTALDLAALPDAMKHIDVGSMHTAIDVAATMAAAMRR